ncbi:MAG: phosphonate ABC transporter substrate-binding protein [Spirochaetales bacterium]|nr:phosphonate ABC transporter substrate-binding protein [Spirochaetales bacterium]
MKKKCLFFLLVLFTVLNAFSNGGNESANTSVNKNEKWQDKYPVVFISAVSSENEADRIARYKFLQDYLQEQLKVQKVEFFAASDYAGTIEAQAAGKVHFARYGTASYARAYRTTNGGVEALMCDLSIDGSSGYHSVLWVRKDSSYKSIDDLKGKSLVFADPNSTSGFLVPTFYLTKAGMDPDIYFSRTGFGGNHEGAILAVIDGTYDAAANFYTNEESSNVQRMNDKGMIDKNDLRLIWKSPVITNGPWAALKDLPDQMKKDFIDAIINWPERDNNSWTSYYSPSQPVKTIEVGHERYSDFIEMQKWVDAKEKEKASQ